MSFKSMVCLMVALAVSGITAGAELANFDDIALDENSYWDGSDGAGGVFNEAAFFYNNFNFDWYSWDGFSISNINDTTATGWASQYNAITGSGQGGTENYAVGYVGWTELPQISFNQATVEGLYVTNNTYVYYDLINGSGFGKKFGGPTGNDPDWFMLTIIGKDANGNIKGAVDFYLADFRFADNTEDYIVDTWQYVDLTSLGTVTTLEFNLTSSDSGAYGMNTPAYFVIDTITISGYAPKAGDVDSTAISMTDPNIKSWASGWENYIVGTYCIEKWQTPEKAIGDAKGDSNDIVCLGRGGEITMTFDSGISDGPGYDFAVFENSFDDYFLELAYVEVSSDGQNFFRLPNNSLTAEEVIFKYPLVDVIVQPTNIGGLAGKYIQGYGTPFDLKVMRRLYPQLDIHNIQWVRIVDIVGDGSCLDSSGDLIYDPYPTTGSAGFDLDAVGVMNLRAGDINQDGQVNELDLIAMTQAWQSTNWDSNWDSKCDISKNQDSVINYKDYATFANQWKQGKK